MLEELDRVRAFGADIPEPDDATVLAARAELMAAIQAGGRPAGPAGPAHAARARRRRRRRLALAGAIAAAALAAGGVLGLNTAGTSSPALASTLSRLAHVAARQAWSGIPGPGQYLYTKSEGVTETDVMSRAPARECAIRLHFRREIWIATDGSGAIKSAQHDGRFTSPADAAVCGAQHVTPDRMAGHGAESFRAGGLSVPVKDWHALSTDPATLLRQIHQLDGGPDTPTEHFVNVGDLMRETDAPPAIRAALYRAAALIPGVRLVGPTTDPVGRTGLGIEQGTHVLIFDQHDARLLAEETLGDDGKPTDWTAYLESKIVDRHPDYPVD